MSFLVRSACASVIAGAALLGSSAFAGAQPPPPPNCTLADQSGVLSGVTASLSAYMFTHPDVNMFFTGLRGLAPDERRAKVDEYLNANPQVEAELKGVRAPMTDFRNRCGLPPAGMPDA